MITDDTTSYLGGYGTEDQQQAFQDGADQIKAAYQHAYPDDPEDMDDMIADQLSGAAQYALGDATLTDLAQVRDQAQRTFLTAQDELRGAAVTAVGEGRGKSEVAREAGISRVTLDKWLEG